jgi:hypothetical protein
MFLSLKKLSKIVGEVTYSWKMYMNIIDSIMTKIVRDLNSAMNNPSSKRALDSSSSIMVSTPSSSVYAKV